MDFLAHLKDVAFESASEDAATAITVFHRVSATIDAKFIEVARENGDSEWLEDQA